MKVKTIVLSILLLGFIIGNWLLIQHLVSSNSHLFKKNQQKPDAYMINAHFFSTDKKGIVTTQFFTPKIIHYAKNNSTKFTKPYIIVNNDQHKQWLITAKKGKSFHGENEIILIKHVKIRELTPQHTTSTTLTTSELTIEPKKHTATTQAPVTIVQGKSTMHAVGLVANFKTGTITLLHQVVGHYIPVKKSTKVAHHAKH